MTVDPSPPRDSPPDPPRLALCGNVFPSDTPGAVLAVLEGPVRDWAQRLRASGYFPELGFGLYLSARSVTGFAREDRELRLRAALARAGVTVWTANAFPYGDFHGALVKEQAFLPDWRESRRLSYSCRVAEALAHLMMPGQSGSFSSCPLGYGPDARRSRRSVEHLQRLQEGLLRLEERTGVRLTLALEPEPDGAFERVADLGDWLLKEVLGDLEPDQRRIGICWDLCHSAVVGETPEEALACFEAGVPCGKIQVSSALECDAELGPEDLAVLEGLSRDPYLHQVRGRLRDGRPYACSDLARLLAHPSDLGELASLRIHCHVPVHRETYGGALGATRWRDAVAAALAAGHREFELETYTLPVLPPAFLEGSSTVATLVAETRASGAALGLADPSPAS